MSDLISRESVINILCELRIDNISVNGKSIMEHIGDIPTAYDVDAVIQLVMTDICDLPLSKEELDNLRNNLILSIKDGGVE